MGYERGGDVQQVMNQGTGGVGMESKKGGDQIQEGWGQNIGGWDEVHLGQGWSTGVVLQEVAVTGKGGLSEIVCQRLVQLNAAIMCCQLLSLI